MVLEERDNADSLIVLRAPSTRGLEQLVAWGTASFIGQPGLCDCNHLQIDWADTEYNPGFVWAPFSFFPVLPGAEFPSER